MFLKLLVFSVFLNLVSSFVLFTHSVLYDTTDFVDNRKIKLPDFCKKNGCHIYVTPISDWASDFAKKITVTPPQVGLDNSDLYTISTKYRPNKSKIPGVFYPLTTESDYYIENNNDIDSLKVHYAPMVVYVVSRTAPHIDGSVVFDYDQVPNPLPEKIVMFMNNDLTTLEIAPSTAANSVVMRTVGFDNADGKADGCNYVLDTKSSGMPFPGVSKQLINTQIITLMFDSVQNVQITQGTLITWNYYLDDNASVGFVTSLGHIGCSKKDNNDELYSVQSLRSSNFYPSTFYYLISQDNTMNVHFDWVLDVMIDHPITVTSNGEETRFAGQNHRLLSNDFTDTKNLKIEADREVTNVFMARFSTMPTAHETSSSSPHESTTSGSGMATVSAVVLSSVLAMINR